MRTLRLLKKIGLVVGCAASIAVSGYALAEHDVPGGQPGVVGEQLISREMGNQFMRAGSKISLCQLLGPGSIGPFARINSVMLVASAQPEVGKRDGNFDLLVNGQQVSREWVGQRMEAIHIWLDRPVTLSAGSCAVDIVFNQDVVVALVGFIGDGFQQIPAQPPVDSAGYQLIIRENSVLKSENSALKTEVMNLREENFRLLMRPPTPPTPSVTVLCTCVVNTTPYVNNGTQEYPVSGAGSDFNSAKAQAVEACRRIDKPSYGFKLINCT